ncbi:MAG: redox-regulated molecular chaperone Hsp33 [Halieaceae bacterium MED-G26]|nr:MAG: redox-regulated molecular chaperone Hsp33 [Halieaceae bacterium MED-G26]
MPKYPTNDDSYRFLFENADIRGETVILDNVLKDLLATHEYGPGVQKLLGEFAAATVVISNNLKFDGKVVLQGRGDGPISLIMVECSSDGHIRGIARGALDAPEGSLRTHLAEGVLTLTIEPEIGQRYQGIIAIQRDELADVLSDYFAQSEQLATKFWLSTRAGASAGLMLQQLPKQLVTSEEARLDQWQTLCALADTMTPDELLDTETDRLLFRLFNEWDVKRFKPKRIRFSCNCSRDRSLNAIRLLPDHEITELFEEQQTVTMNCEMCGESYHFTRNDVDQSEEPTIH